MNEMIHVKRWLQYPACNKDSTIATAEDRPRSLPKTPQQEPTQLVKEGGGPEWHDI